MLPKCLVCLLATILALVAMPATRAGADDNVQLYEQEIQAGLLYNFLKYTVWPTEKLAQDPTTMVVCIYGDDPFGSYLQPMEGRTVNQRTIVIRMIHEAKEAGGCHLLYINPTEKDQWPALSQAISGKMVLTVSGFKNFSASGGMIEFGRKENHIAVFLNIDAITLSKLQVQPRLLKLVTVVHHSSGSGGQ
jgi:hypothetical protein